MIQTNNIDKQEKKFKETIIKTYKMDSIDTQDFIDKTLAEIKLSGILDNSHEITIFTSYFRPAYTCFSYITNDKGNDFFIPYLPTTQISGGIISEYAFARMLFGEEDTYNLIEELCNRITQIKHINVKNIYNPCALPYIWSDELFTPSAAYLYSRPEENIKICKQWQTLYKEKYAKQKENSRGTYSDKSDYYDYLDYLFETKYPNSYVFKEFQKIKLYEQISLDYYKLRTKFTSLNDEKNSKKHEALARKYAELAKRTYDNIQKNNIKKHTDEESKEIEYIEHDIQKWKKQLKDIRKRWKHSKRKHNMDEEIELIKEFVKQKETR